MAETFPEDWRDQPCYLVPIPKPLIPLVGGMVRMLEYRGFWLSNGDYERGYTAIVEFEANLAMNCITEITERQDALYRMLNTGMFGVTYATTSTEPLIVEPAIAPHVTLDLHSQDSLLGRVDRLTQLVDNRLAGTETDLYSDLPGIKQQLEEIIAALGEGTDLTEVISNLEAIALLLA